MGSTCDCLINMTVVCVNAVHWGAVCLSVLECLLLPAETAGSGNSCCLLSGPGSGLRKMLAAASSVG